ncbi:hypothetical protein RJZ90_005955 [Blastomyces dermatitidis]
MGPAIRRLARRGGVVRMQKDIYDTIRSVILMRLREIIRKLVVLLEGSKYPNKERKTITVRDVAFILQGMGNPVYGFE